MGQIEKLPRRTREGLTENVGFGRSLEGCGDVYHTVGSEGHYKRKNFLCIKKFKTLKGHGMVEKDKLFTGRRGDK